MKGEVAKAVHEACRKIFWLIKYSVGHVNCFVSIHVLLQLSVFYHYHEENEASYTVWLSCSEYPLFTLSDKLVSFCLQEDVN